MPSSAANISLLPLIEITTPLLNSVYTPGSTLIMTWTNVDALFPEDWSPPQSILDAIAQDNPSLPYDEKVSLAKTQVQTLKRSQLATAIKDSPIWLKDLRLVSWPFQKSVDLLEIGAFSDHTGDEHDSENPDSPHLWGMWPDRAAREMQQPSSATPPSALFDSGFSLQDLAKLTILGTAGGQLSWIIPEDWEYEGEFEIRIPSVFKGADELAGSNKDEPHMAASHSFWILRDAATRDHSPQYNVPSVDQLKYGTSFMPDRNEPEGSTVALLKKNIKQQRDLGIFLGVAAMMLALVLLGLGAFIGIYRRKWVKSLAASTSAASDGDSDPSAEYTYTHMGSMPSPTKGTKPLIQFSTRPADPLQPARGDDDAHSPTNLGDSEDTLHGSAQSTEYLPFSEKAVMNVQQRN
ncbi:hypothetical protein EDD11_004551 [Mortierella claussenii]|nr:hypothetical protein EDD11_004551 [Mortierella claussenii]